MKQQHATRLLFRIIAVFLLMTGATDIHAKIEGSWKFHPAVNMTNTVSGSKLPNHVLKIMDTGKYAYFLMHSTSYKADVQEYSHGVARPLLFRAENSAITTPDKTVNIEYVGNLMETGGIYVTAAEYNPEGGYIAVGYTNGNIDLIYDNGEISTITGMQSIIPTNGKAEVTSFSFERGTSRIWVATRFGFLTIDSEQKKITDCTSLGRSVLYVAKVGDSIVATTEDGVMEASASKKDWNSSDFHVLTIDTANSSFGKSETEALSDTTLFHKTTRAMVQCTFLYHLGDNTFFTSRTQNKPGSATGTLNGYIIQRSQDGSGKWRAMLMENISIQSSSPSSNNLFIGQNIFGLHTGGMHYFSGSKYIELSDGATMDLSAAKPIDDFMSRYRKVTGTTGTPNRTAGTGDGKTFWFYEPFKGFVRADYDGTWTEKCAVSRPDLPPVALSVAMKWHPRYGMLVRQHGLESLSEKDVPTDYDMICGYKDGKWTDYSIITRTPELKETFKNGEGIEIDPDDDRYIYAGSRFGGILRLNLDDPQDILHMSRTSDPAKNLNGYVELVSDCIGWKSLASFSCPKVDSYGNAWSARWSFDDDCTELWYWKDEDRKASKDPTTFRKWNKIATKFIPRHYSNSFLLLKNSLSMDFLVINPSGYEQPLTIYDFNGTPDNTEDDRWSSTINCYNENGAQISIPYFNSLIENPLNGNVYAGTENGLFVINPTELLNGNKEIKTIHVKTSENQDASYYDPFEMQPVRAFEFDGEGRFWVGVKGGGLYCLSEDGSELYDIFTAENSGLMDNNIIGLAWNPEEKSLMVSSLGGLQEFKPYSTSKDMSADNFSIFPSRVTPDYEGWITLTGVNDSASLILRDKDGKALRTLYSARDGRVQFSVRDNKGVRLPSGEITVTDKDGMSLGKFLLIE